MKFNIGDKVYVPRGRVGLDQDGMSTFIRARVIERAPCKIQLDLPGGLSSDWISVSFAKERIKAVVITLGDFKSEFYSFNPLAKSVLHHLRLLVGPEEAIGIKVRSIEELEKFWSDQQSEISHVVLIGHGNGNGVYFGVDGWISGSTLADTLRIWGAPKKHFLSLCCQSGKAGFAKAFSKAAICEDFVAPFHTVHAAAAAQFYSTYFVAQYLGGMTSKVAYNYGDTAVVDRTIFRFWDNGVSR